MKLLTKEIEQRFKQVGSQESAEEPIVIVKFFDPVGSGTWYATEAFYVLADGAEVEAWSERAKDLWSDSPGVRDVRFFGWAYIIEGEYGYFSLRELESVRGFAGLGIERDMYFGEPPIKSCIAKHPSSSYSYF